ncbi:hypothetical protein ACEUZ9_000964 [Paracoccus litorisediminis]|uniref:hypothetical protein n=1 Tax=Paracoccus litorisediminis TaxID=2006130 RepID=UPI0037341523
MARIDDDLLEEIQSELEGTCTTISEIIEQRGLDIDEDAFEDRLLDGNAIERCKCCEWWFTSTSLEFDPDRNGGVCEQCMPELHES